MNSIRRLIFALTLSVLSFLLFFLASFFALRQTVFNEAYIKATLSSSGVYNNFIDGLIELSSANIAATPGQSGTVELTKLTPVIKQSVTPEYLQSVTEEVVNGTFIWLRGDASQPAFKINTAEVKAGLQTNTSAFLKNQLAALPVCPPGTAYVNFNPLTASCRPSFAIPDSELESYANQFVTSLPLGKTDVTTFQDIVGTNVNQAALTTPPKVYQTFNWLPFALMAAILAVIALDVLFVRNHRLAMQKIGHSLVWAGGFLLVSGIVVLVFINNFSASKLLNAPTAAQGAFLNQTVLPVADTIAKSLANFAIYFGVGYAILGAGFYFWAHTMRMNQLEQNPEKVDSLSTDEPKTV